MNLEDDEYCTADYGVFGDRACNCSSCNSRPINIKIVKSRNKDNSAEISYNFNRHMIDLYNQARK